MECTEVEVHTHNIKPRDYRCVFKARWQLCLRLTGNRHLSVAFVNEDLGILGLIVRPEGRCCGMLTWLSTVC